MSVMASMTGARITEIPVKHYVRKRGFSKYGYDRIYKVFCDILAINLIIRFSSTPLKGFVYCAVPFIGLTICFGLFAVLAIFFGWSFRNLQFFMITASLNGMCAVNLILLGILGELVVSNSETVYTNIKEIIKK
jgi:hypothetical protein